MVTWGSINDEIIALVKTGKPVSIDPIRHRYLDALAKHTGRNLVLYATKWTVSGASLDPESLSIVPEDREGFIEVFSNLDKTKGLDLILHSPGGSPTAAEALVTYIRSTFSDLRVIVPQAAMSAATMISCAANKHRARRALITGTDRSAIHPPDRTGSNVRAGVRDPRAIQAGKG